MAEGNAQVASDVAARTKRYDENSKAFQAQMESLFPRPEGKCIPCITSWTPDRDVPFWVCSKYPMTSKEANLWFLGEFAGNNKPWSGKPELKLLPAGPLEYVFTHRAIPKGAVLI